jgi:CIC family chloride channel protein
MLAVIVDAFPGMSPLAAAAAVLAFFAAGVLILKALRPLLRRRVRAAGGGGEGRLGVEKSYAFGARRLIVLRRGAARHIVMTGGPNDAVVASNVSIALSATGAESGLPEAEEEGGPAQAESRTWRNGLLSRALAGEGLVPLALLSGAAGAFTGIICGLFRLLLEKADRLRMAVPVLWQDTPAAGCLLLMAGAAAAGAFGAFLVRRFSEHAAGSGIPHVEAAIGGELPPAPLALLPVKFFGGLAALGAGFALGREGPCVQMGATVAELLGKAAGRPPADRLSLLAAGAGAGLAAAFNAPLAGSAFVLEEIMRKFELRNAIAALGAAGSAIVVARLFTGPAPEFLVTDIPYPALGDNLLCFVLGAAAGVLGFVFSRVLFATLAAAHRLARWPVELRAAAVGAAAGAIAWFAPVLAGGGDLLTQRTLDGSLALAALPFIWVLRLFFGAASYAAGTPGGIFAPLLVLGAQMGFMFGGLCDFAAGGGASRETAFAMVGMAALFAAVVRAPLTGMILVTEMTDSSTLLLPMLAACFPAMAVATMLREPPVYDALKERILAAWHQKENAVER